MDPWCVRRDPCGTSWEELEYQHSFMKIEKCTHELALRQIQRGVRILPERLQRQWVQRFLARLGVVHLGQSWILVLGWRFLGERLRERLAEERARLVLWVEQQPWLGQAQEMALRRLYISLVFPSTT